MDKYIWISWERQRRSVELAKAFNAELFILNYGGYLRYLKCLFKTFYIVWEKRPNVIFVQNPSMVLALFSTLFLKPLFRTPIVVDRHSNFLLFEEKLPLFKRVLFNLLSGLTICSADITIITNDPLWHFVKICGGTPFVLPDKLPNIVTTSDVDIVCREKKSLFLISSFGKDEPFEVIWMAIDKIKNPDLIVYVSGNYKKLSPDLIACKPEKVKFTGFIPDAEFDNLLTSVDAVMVLTNSEYVLLCGCYEAVSAEKPLITSNTEVLKKLFSRAHHADLSAGSIAEKIRECFSDLEKHKSSIVHLKKTMNDDWDCEFNKLCDLVSKLSKMSQR